MVVGSILAGTSLVAYGDSISTVYVSLGPNANYPSLSYPGYTTNAQTSVKNGVTVPGYPATPVSYNTVSTITTGDMTIDDNFNNWRGTANPPPPFQNEYGTMVFFSIDIKGNGTNDLSLAQISTTTSDNDPYFQPGGYFSDSYSYSGSTYDTDKVGYFAQGGNTTPGDPANTMVAEIVMTSYGVAFDASGYPGSGQTQLNNAIAAANTLGNFTINVCYSDFADGLSSCGSVNVVATPEPTTFAFIGLGIVAFPFVKKRRSKQ
jgi:hypothetical protein